jgi:hypothetical protein
MIWLGVAAVVAALLLGCLLIPLRFEVEIPEQGRARTELSWAFGLVSRDLLAQVQRPEKARRPAQKRRARGPWIRQRLLAAVRSAGFFHVLARFAARLFRATHPRDVSFTAVVGLEDPSDTGRLWAVGGPLALALSTASGGKIALTPDFAGEHLQVQGQGRFTVVPAQVMAIAAWFLVTLLMLPGRPPRRSARVRRPAPDRPSSAARP